MNRGLELLKKDEGTKKRNGRHIPYKCTAGKLTIGYGTNIEDGITDEEAEFLLNSRANAALRDLREIFPHYDSLSEVRQAVLINMVYNLGENRFKGFEKTIGYIKSQAWDYAADQMINSKWYNDVKNRAKRLVVMMRTNEWPKDYL